MKRSFLALALIISAITLNSCTKHKGDFTENLPVATVTVAQPLAGAIYNNGDTVIMSALAISTATIHGYDISIKSPGDTTQYFFKHVHDHNDTLNINEKWKNTIAGKNLQLNITIVLDHDGHTYTKRVDFRAK